VRCQNGSCNCTDAIAITWFVIMMKMSSKIPFSYVWMDAQHLLLGWMVVFWGNGVVVV
jgi:hypothetical protein